jgi:hypothetical protein
MLKKSIVFAVLMCAVVVLGAADLASAQATETVTVRGTGVVMGKSGETLVVDVKEGRHLGMRRFSWKDLQDVKFYNQRGEAVQPSAIRVGSTLTVEYTETREAPVVVTMTEVRQMDEVAEVAAAPAPAPAPAAPAPAPAAMPSTASSLPLVLMVGFLVLAFAATLTVVRRS